MGWAHPVPGGVQTRGFAPSSFYADAAMFSDDAIRRAHDTGNGSFPGSVYWPHFHAALDIAAAYGTPIYAPEAGEVLDAKWGTAGTWANGGGWFVRVLVNERCMYLLAHCSQLHVVQGQQVKKGQLIARIGATGVATGNHTHFVARLGPRAYYDPAAFFWNPALILPGGPLYGDARFAPGYEELPDTGTPDGNLLVDGDPAPMKYQSMLDNGQAPLIHVRAFKPIRAGAEVNDRKITTTGDRGRDLRTIGRIRVGKLPASEQPYGDVYICPLYVENGTLLGYVKQVDIR